jgi:hypothetical protein
MLRIPLPAEQALIESFKIVKQDLSADLLDPTDKITSMDEKIASLQEIEVRLKQLINKINANANRRNSS